MSKPSRKTAFRATRTICGDEICPRGREVIQVLNYGRTQVFGGEKADFTDAVSTINGMTTTTHHLRQALAGLLVLYTQPDLKKCPNCEKPLSKHDGSSCHLDKLIRAVVEP